MITKEQIEQRIALLQKQYDQVEAHGNALIGAIQDCEFWLKQMDVTRDGGGTVPPSVTLTQ